MGSMGALDEIYSITGSQSMTVNTLFQLFYDTRFRSLVEHAHALLFMPDLFSYALTGEKYNEYTIAPTSMMLIPDAESGRLSYLSG